MEKDDLISALKTVLKLQKKRVLYKLERFNIQDPNNEVLQGLFNELHVIHNLEKDLENF